MKAVYLLYIAVCVYVCTENVLCDKRAKPEGLRHPHKVEVTRRKLVPTDSRLWPNGIVVYEFNKGTRKFVNPLMEKLVRGVMNVWEQQTCVKFISRSQTSRYGVTHNNYIDIGKGKGCSAVIGYANRGKQSLTLNEKRCKRAATIAHELAHAMGLYHEQARADRSRYIYIHLQNIKRSKLKNFNMAFSRLVAPYDLSSIMHYGRRFFTKIKSRNTISVKDHRLNFLIGQRIAPSFYDYLTVNKGYKCDKSCSKKNLVCHNDGYQDSSCKCRCVDGLAGEQCQSVASVECGRSMYLSDDTPSITIMSPNYPNPYIYTRCVWLFKVAEKRQIVATLVNYEIPKSAQKRTCGHWLEVRYTLVGQRGPRYCGSSSSPLIFRSLTNSLLVNLDATNVKYKPSKGFKMTVKIIPLTGCEATSGPCKNGGQCQQDDPSSIKCSCKAGFTGQFCQFINREISCNFNNGNLCFLTQDITDQFQWRLKRGRTKSKYTGPSYDVSRYGYYIYTEASKPQQKGDIARLYIANMTGGSWCFQCRYHMFGKYMGQLRVYLALAVNYRNSKAYVITGNHGNRWRRLALTFYSKQNFYVVIEGIRGKGWSSDLALDNLVLKPGSCQAPRYTLVIVQTPSAYTFLCDFTNDFCGMKQDKTDEFDWWRVSRRRGWRRRSSRPTSRTGPHRGYGGGGKFIYMETSKPRFVGQRAKISTPFLNYKSQDVCISFAVHTYGSSLGSLAVQVNQIGEGYRVIWGASGPITHNPGWKLISLNLNVSPPFQVVFEGVVGKSYRGDYALDNINVHTGTCKASVSEVLPFSCDFETSTCSMMNSNVRYTSVKWEKYSYSQPDGKTTTTMSALHKLDTRQTSRISKFETSVFTFAGFYCLQFNYAIDSDIDNPLTVYLHLSNSNNVKELWYQTLQAYWNKARVQFYIVGKAKIVFSSRVYWGYARYTIDNIQVTIGKCN